MERYQEIERSIIKKYRKELWSPFARAIDNYKLIDENDKIMVCISGGKDSFLLAKCIEEIQRHGKVKFEARYVVMNPGYNELNLKKIIENAKILNLNIEIFESDIFSSVENGNFKSPCYMCARMRRGYLYNKARELGCNKIALGHHMDDVIETTLLSMFYSSEVIELIRPLFLIREKDIITWAKSNGLDFINCACKFTERSAIDENLSKRKEMKNLIKEMSKTNPNVAVNIFTALDNINLNCVLGTKKDGIYRSFLDDYDKIK